jgi:hypothetical protein
MFKNQGFNMKIRMEYYNELSLMKDHYHPQPITYVQG